MSETTEHYDRVRRFMRLAEQATPDAPTEMGVETRELRARLLIEEAFETIQRGLGINVYADGWHGAIGHGHLSFEAADDAYNPIELLDGCCDVNVITTGTLIAAGLTDAEPQRLVDENNLAKFGPGGYRRGDGKWIKPPNHQPPDLASEIERQRCGTDQGTDHLTGSSSERDSDGMFCHPAIPWDRIPDEQDCTPFLRVLGYEPHVIAMDGDDDVATEKYAEGDMSAAVEWQPSQPDGDGWWLAAIYDTEDGPHALWLRSEYGHYESERRDANRNSAGAV